MANFSIQLDLLKLRQAFVTNIKGRNETKRCVVIPIDDAGLYVGEKGVYLNLTANELREIKFNQTHLVKVDVPKEQYDKLSEEDRKNLPIVGNMKQREPRQGRAAQTTQTVDVGAEISQDKGGGDDLPF